MRQWHVSKRELPRNSFSPSPSQLCLCNNVCCRRVRRWHSIANAARTPHFAAVTTHTPSRREEQTEMRTVVRSSVCSSQRAGAGAGSRACPPPARRCGGEEVRVTTTRRGGVCFVILSVTRVGGHPAFNYTWTPQSRPICALVRNRRLCGVGNQLRGRQQCPWAVLWLPRLCHPTVHNSMPLPLSSLDRLMHPHLLLYPNSCGELVGLCHQSSLYKRL